MGPFLKLGKSGLDFLDSGPFFDLSGPTEFLLGLHGSQNSAESANESSVN